MSSRRQTLPRARTSPEHQAMWRHNEALVCFFQLQMLGYDISWAAFNVIEVMSSSKFTHKRIGYLCASQCFSQETDVLMLTTNMIRKDLSSQNQYEAGVSLTGLSCFVSHDLAQDLVNDVITLVSPSLFSHMTSFFWNYRLAEFIWCLSVYRCNKFFFSFQLSSTKPYIRKKAVLLLYKIFLNFPDALRPAFPRLKEKLEDPDPGNPSILYTFLYSKRSCTICREIGNLSKMCLLSISS